MTIEKFKSIGRDIWLKIVDIIIEVDSKDLQTLVSIDDFFCEILDSFYREVCLNSKIYRLEHEYWAKAFYDAPRRIYNLGMVISKDLIFCPKTDRFALAIKNHVVISTLDVSKRFYKYIPIDFEIGHMALIKNGTLLSVWHQQRRLSTVHIFSVDSESLIFKKAFKSRCTISNGSAYIHQDGKVFDAYDQTEHTLQRKDVNGFNCYYANRTETQYFVLFHTRGVVVMNSLNETIYERVDYKAFYNSTNFFILPESGFIFNISEAKSTMTIYSVQNEDYSVIKTKEPHSIWVQLSDYSIANYTTGKILYYEKTENIWKEYPKKFKKFWDDPYTRSFNEHEDSNARNFGIIKEKWKSPKGVKILTWRNGKPLFLVTEKLMRKETHYFEQLRDLLESRQREGEDVQSTSRRPAKRKLKE
ncbi:unnamed protein product [Bursaphelenchus xylophilus]|uniref:(pine wood nematode) hypothetical protein n=1 Tax=Bursaphelenchus xylophilus TaxID=6326 RepID=A0A1I7RYQ3_BURXY|nr:unnamed protein product [Bursaphelenchus xylophilus]CAG9092389.1 unnamed protein product [Bursaphelenchus xylophilus]